jgi:membrane protein implicated in regulation of membrane protease activity
MSLFPVPWVLRGTLVLLFLLGFPLLVFFAAEALGSGASHEQNDWYLAMALTLPGAAVLVWELRRRLRRRA